MITDFIPYHPRQCMFRMFHVNDVVLLALSSSHGLSIIWSMLNRHHFLLTAVEPCLSTISRSSALRLKSFRKVSSHFHAASFRIRNHALILLNRLVDDRVRTRYCGAGRMKQLGYNFCHNWRPPFIMVSPFQRPKSLSYYLVMKLSDYLTVKYKILTDIALPRRFSGWVSRLLVSASLLVFFFVITFHFYRNESGQKFEPETLNAEPGEGSLGSVRGPDIAVPSIPFKFRTVGLIFYGRRSRVEILDCYLKVRF